MGGHSTKGRLPTKKATTGLPGSGVKPASPGGLVLPAMPVAPPHPAHRGGPVRVGRYTIYAGGTRYLQPEDLDRADVIIPLESQIPARVGQCLTVLACPWRDFGPPPDGFEQFLRGKVIPLLAQGKRLLAYCIGSHGRTGTFLASLIALLETSKETPDPIEAARVRHCYKAVETLAQAEAVFALRGQTLPEKYRYEFASRPTAAETGLGGFGHGLFPGATARGTGRMPWEK